MSTLKILVVGCGNMGASHARAYHAMDEFEIVGLVSRGPESREKLSAELGGLPTFSDYQTALDETTPDAVSINTYPDTHHDYARRALEAGAHLFIEKPLADTVEQAREIVDLARAKGRVVVVGYILRVHPAWAKFIEIARTLGKPLVMRMNLNQQSRGKDWTTHKNLMNSMSPIVDCGVHYVDVMCQMTGSRPLRVSAIGARLTDELNDGMYNYGQLQVAFEDGSVGWYECGWGPMMSETAYFVKDVVGPNGAASIVPDKGRSDDKDHHVEANTILRHFAEQQDKEFVHEDERILIDEPDHEGLAVLEQRAFIDCIRNDRDMWSHQDRVLTSLQIVFAADESQRMNSVVEL